MTEKGTTAKCSAACQLLTNLATTAKEFETTLLVQKNGEKARLRLFIGNYGNAVHYQTLSRNCVGVTRVVPSVNEGLYSLVEDWRSSIPSWIYYRLTINKDLVSSRDCHLIVVRAWCEVLGINEPSDLDDIAASAGQSANSLRAELLTKLQSGNTLDWNAAPRELIQKAEHFQKSPLKGAQLNGANLSIHDVFHGDDIADWSKSDFSKATLRDASLYHCKIKQCKFTGSDLTGATLVLAHAGSCKFNKSTLTKADLSQAHLPKADFTEAVLSNTRIQGAYLSGAKFINATLDGADLTGSHLNGVDFTGASMCNTNLKEARYDEKTIWPAGLNVCLEELQWGGRGANPLRVKQMRENLAAIDLTVGELIDKLNQEGYEDRLRKALAMLKADRFQLFADVGNDCVLGVIKSQTDPDLLYSCRLTNEGSYYCCSQNLFPCGGLRGYLCKHILALILGLTNAGQLSATTAYSWAMLSSARNPELEKDLATETLFRYKGAEAGDIDWRPTETLPEDYYAF